MRVIISILLTFNLLSAYGQSVNARFLMRSGPDNGWFLELQKNNVYIYYESNMIAGAQIVLDSGTYKISNGQITFNSLVSKEKFNNNDVTFYLLQKRVKRYQECCSWEWSYNKKGLFNTNIIKLTTKETDSIVICSNRDKDHIARRILSPDTNLHLWIENNYLPHFKPYGLDSYNFLWIPIFKTKGIEVLQLLYPGHIFEIFFAFNDKVYFPSIGTDNVQYSIILKECRKKKLITKNQKEELKTKIDSLIQIQKDEWNKRIK